MLFRRLLTMVALLGFMLAGATLPAQDGRLSDDPNSRLSTIPHNATVQQALRDARVERIVVRHTGWNETLFTWARLKVHELTGRAAIHGQDPVFTVLSMMYETEKWYDARFLPLEDPRVAAVLKLDGEQWISPRQVIESEGLQTLYDELQAAADRKEERERLKTLLDYVHQIRTIGENRPGVYGMVVPADNEEEITESEVRRLVDNSDARERAHAQLDELTRTVKAETHFLDKGVTLKERTLLASQLADQFFIVPDTEDPEGDWIAARDAFGASRTASIRPASFGGLNEVLGFRAQVKESAAMLENRLSQTFLTGNAWGLNETVEEFLGVVTQTRAYPSDRYISMKNFYVGTAPTRLSALFYGLAVLLFGLFLFWKHAAFRWAGVGAFAIALGLHTLGQVIRLLLTGHMPVSNMYESIVFASWSAMTIALVLELWRRNGLIGAFGATVGMLALMGVSLMPLHDTRLHPLRAVLNSYWLNIHVTAMLISYGAFMVATAFGIGYLVKSFLKREALFGGKPVMTMDQMEEFAYRLVQVGWPILTIGILLGAVWADTAWGRFWGWDPKETWALITWITYTIYLHSRMVLGWKGRISAFACVLGFLMVLITWLGVSYMPWFAGGLHTYASPT